MKDHAASATTIRPFRARDYQAIAEVLSAAYPEHPTQANELEREDEETPSRIRFGRIVLEHEGKLIGHAYFGNMQELYDARVFWVSPTIHPDFHGQGFGRALYAALEAELRRHRPTRLFTWTREDWKRRTRFLLDRRFVEVMRSFESRLTLDQFDPSRHESAAAALSDEGIRLVDLREFSSRPDYRERLYHLHTALDADVPTIGTYTESPFDEFVSSQFAEPRLVEDTYIIAVKGDEPVALTQLFHDPNDPDVMTTGLTGVARGHRGKGAAMAMKVAALRAAKRLGYREVRTWNAEENRAMLKLNDRLGFVRRPASIEMTKEWK